MGLDAQSYLSQNLPAPKPIEGKVVGLEPTPGKYGHAEVAGVQFGVTSVALRMGAVIFTCTLMRPATFAFTIEPGVPAKIYGVDGSLIVDYRVPGVDGSRQCDVRPGDLLTLQLPCRLTDMDSLGTDERVVYDNRMHTH